jgi:hypothetical protein
MPDSVDGTALCKRHGGWFFNYWCDDCLDAARIRLEAAARELGGYGRENINQFLRGNFSAASPEDVEHLRSALVPERERPDG